MEVDMLILKQPKIKELLKELVAKLDEETCEVYHAMACESKERQVEETLDVIQVCIAILDNLEGQGVNIQEQLEKHNSKLLSRNWRYKAVLHITKEGEKNG